jgi:hypothetical protein
MIASVRFHHPDEPDKYSEDLTQCPTQAIKALMTGTGWTINGVIPHAEVNGYGLHMAYL